MRIRKIIHPQSLAPPTPPQSLPPKNPELLPPQQQHKMRIRKIIHPQSLAPPTPRSQWVAAKSLIVVPPNINYTVSYD
jgi:hypothetical protein